MRSLRVLVVEDDMMIAELLSEMIMDMGHRVCAIETTEAGAVAAAARHGPDLMIVDARLGADSGVAAISKILLLGPVAHLVMSGADVAGSVPGTVILQKPFRESELVRAMACALGAETNA